MSHNFRLTPADYTIKNALLWGISKAHLDKARTETVWHGRIVHVITALIEAIPIVGQIVSLIEMGIIKFFEHQDRLPSVVKPAPKASDPVPPSPPPLPEPESCKPTTRAVKYQTDKNEPCRYWPEDLTLLGLSEEHKNLIDTHLKEILKETTNVELPKKKIVYSYAGASEKKIAVDIPRTLTIFRNENGQRECILFSKNVFFAGGERKIRWAYNLTTGEFLLKKRIVGKYEHDIVQILANKRALRDTAFKTTLIWRNPNTNPPNAKLHLIEPLRDGSLLSLFGTSALTEFSTKKGLVSDFLNDLKSLHEEKITGSVTVKATIWERDDKTVNLNHPTYHLDLKFNNLLVFKKDGKWRGEMCDFGGGCSTAWNPIRSSGFTSPETLKYYMDIRPYGMDKTGSFEKTEEVINFVKEHAVGQDIWSMGLIVLSIMSGKFDRAFFQSHTYFPIAPLACLKKAVKYDALGEYHDRGIIYITQDELDADINALEKEAMNVHSEDKSAVAELFTITRKMLKIDPQKRATTESLFKEHPVLLAYWGK